MEVKSTFGCAADDVRFVVIVRQHTYRKHELVHRIRSSNTLSLSHTHTLYLSLLGRLAIYLSSLKSKEKSGSPNWNFVRHINAAPSSTGMEEGKNFRLATR